MATAAALLQAETASKAQQQQGLQGQSPHQALQPHQQQQQDLQQQQPEQQLQEPQQQQSAAATLSWLVPLALLLIFMLLYLQFKRVSTALMIFSSIAIAWAGGFIALDAIAQPDFLNHSFFGANLRELFNLQAFNLSIAVWVGFLALFGIAVDDGIVMATYLQQQFTAVKPQNRAEIRERVCAAAAKRIKPCLMTSATTILALLPVLSSSGRGADLMIPMAVPTLGGMLFVLLSVFMVPVLYAAREEWRWRE